MQNKSQNTPAEPERIDDLKLLAAQVLENLKKPYKPRIITEHFETHYPNPNITFDVEFGYCGDDEKYEEQIQKFYDYLEHDPDYKDRLEAEALLKYYFPEYREKTKLLELMELREKLNITGREEYSNEEYERVREYAYKMNEIKAINFLSESESETTPAAKTNETTEPVKTAEPCATPPAELQKPYNPHIITEHFETHYPNPNITFDVEFDYCGDDKEYEEEIQRFYDYLEHDPDYKDRLEAEALLKYYFPEYREETKLPELIELRKKLNITGRIEHSNKEYERVRDYAYKMNEIKARKQLSESESETTPAAKTNETTEPVKTAEPCATPPAEQKKNIAEHSDCDELKKRQKRKHNKGQVREAYAIFQTMRKSDAPSIRQFKNWLSGKNVPAGFPGIQNLHKFMEWVNKWDKPEKKRSKNIRGVTDEEIYKKRER